MTQQSYGWTRRIQVLALVALATLGLLTACAGSQDAAGPAAGGGVAEDSVVGAPAPLNGPAEAPPVEKRDVVQTASMRITVADPSAAADQAAVIVEDADGRVDSRTEDSGSGTGRALTSIVLRVPVAELDSVVRELKDLGIVEFAQTTSEDVTAQRVDLDARITALQTSVERLLAIMRDARDPEALIAAEGALSQRQAELDSLRAQREALGDRVEFSTVDVTFLAEQIGGPAPQQYQGFLGQVERGWDTLVSVVGSAVLLLGLLVPWLGVLVVAAAICFVVVRVLGTRHKHRPAPVVPDEDDGAAPAG